MNRHPCSLLQAQADWASLLSESQPLWFHVAACGWAQETASSSPSHSLKVLPRIGLRGSSDFDIKLYTHTE